MDTAQTTIRTDRRTLDFIKRIGEFYGRPLNGELDIALHAHALHATLALVNDPAARNDPLLRERLEADPEFEERLMQDLRALHAAAFRRPTHAEVVGQFGATA